MSDTDTSTANTGDAGQTSADTSTDASTDAAAAEPTPEEKLAAAQKINADLERKLKRSDDNRNKVSELEASLAELKAKADGKEAEYAAEQAKRATEQAALNKANGRILGFAVKAAAKGVLADPADAYKFLDLDSFEVSEDGEVDEEAITAALKDLIEKKPYLAAQGGRFQGSADGGTRKGSGPSIDDQIATASLAGNHQLAIALKQRRAAEMAAKKS